LDRLPPTRRAGLVGALDEVSPSRNAAQELAVGLSLARLGKGRRVWAR